MTAANRLLDIYGNLLDSQVMSDNFRLEDLMAVDQAVEQYRFFSRRELFAAMRAGDLRH